MRNGTAYFRQRRKKLVKNLGGKALWSIEKVMEKYSKVPTTPFLDSTEFEWTQKIEKNWTVIRKELDEILKNKEAIPNFQDIFEDQKSITTDNNWKTYFFYGFGYKAEQNCARCPETTKLIESVPGMTTAFFLFWNRESIFPLTGEFIKDLCVFTLAY